MTEYRRAKRRKANDAIEIIDTMTETVIGHLSNLSETGMLLILTQRLTSDALYQFHFRLPGSVGEWQAVEIGAHELWADEVPAGGQVWSGFRFIDVSVQDAARIRDWVESPGSQYV
ncbi:MAG TPA: PilZ domain-containing protein [Arenimonas sp.]|nr:PilZ domain-containing protein [Arenimonas sp.]